LEIIRKSAETFSEDAARSGCPPNRCGCALIDKIAREKIARQLGPSLRGERLSHEASLNVAKLQCRFSMSPCTPLQRA
jgi:hypothetical protein